MKPQEQIRQIRRVTWVGLVLNVTLCAGKILAGLVGNSAALVADGVHSLSDIATDIAILIGVRYWLSPPDRDHPYGHGRLETLVSLMIGLTLAAVGFGLGYDAVTSLLAPEADYGPPGSVALVVATLGVGSKEVIYRWMLRRGRAIGSEALEANARHHRSDALSSLPVLVAVAVAIWFPGLGYVDEAGALLVSVFICYSAWQTCLPAVNSLLDRGASNEVQEAIVRLVAEYPQVIEVHGLRTRFMGKALLVDLHAVVGDESLSVREADALSHAIAATLTSSNTTEILEIQILDALVHIDPPDEESPTQ